MTGPFEPAMDRDRLAAFVDGELSPEEAAELVMHLADHPEDQAFVDDLAAANEALARAFEAPLHEPVPDAIRALILPGTEGNVVPLPPRRGRSFARLWPVGLALAASLATAALIWPVARSLPGQPAVALAQGQVPQGSAVDLLLSAQPSGVPVEIEPGIEAMVVASLPAGDRGYCREVEMLDHPSASLHIGIACTAGLGWSMEVVITEALPDTTETGFVTAGGPEFRAIEAFLDRIGVGPVLDPDEEARLINAGWGG